VAGRTIRSCRSLYSDKGKRLLKKWFIAFWDVLFSFSTLFLVEEYSAKRSSSEFGAGIKGSNQSLKPEAPQGGAP
jgi:hypothetical protein